MQDAFNFQVVGGVCRENITKTWNLEEQNELSGSHSSLEEPMCARQVLKKAESCGSTESQGRLQNSIVSLQEFSISIGDEASRAIHQYTRKIPFLKIEIKNDSPWPT